jgi:Cdc6-like AAA superfamily ATPase
VSSSRQRETGQWRAKRWLCFGRDAEIECLVRALLPETVGFPGVTMVVLTGPHGIGKTTLMNAFGYRVSSRCALNQIGYNVCLFHNPSSCHNIAEPLSAWKSILRQAIHRVALLGRLQLDGTIVDHTDLRGWFLPSLEELLIVMPPELQAMKPLLGDVGIIDAMPDSEQTAGLTSEQRLLALGELLVELLMVFSQRRARRVVLIL